MREYLPVLIVGASIGLLTVLFLAAYLVLKKKQKADFDRQMPDGQIIRRLLRYARPYWGKFLLAFLAMVVSVVYDVVSPLLVGRVEEIIAGKFAMSQILSVVTVYGGILLVSLVCNYLQAMILQKTGQKIVTTLRTELFAHIETLSQGQLNEIPVGKLVTRVNNDTNAISYLFTNILVTLLKNILVILGVLGAMLTLNYTLTLMVLCFVPFIVLFTVIFRAFSRRAHRAVSDSTSDVNTYLSEHLSGMKLIQIFNQQDNKFRAFQRRSKKLEKAKVGRMFVFGIFRPMVYMLNISSVLLLLYLSGKGYIQERAFLGQVITANVMVSFYMYISKFFNPIQGLAEQFDMLQRSFASSEKIFAILDMEPGIQDAPDAIDLPHVEGRIEFQDVWFAYKEDQWVLRGVSFTVEPRQTVAFVGSTGSGKTTILSLLCRNYDIQKGKILVDGIDIRNIRIASLRRHFGQMLQDVFLFSGTIRSNLLLHMENVPEEEILAACRYVNADSLLKKLPNGLDEVVRERGNNFSAGQRQLLSFARTVLHKPSVMILDEATANIDTETELLIQDSLEKMRNIGTMLVVAHRLSTIQHADNIILLSRGKIREQGTHQQLLQQGGRYYKLYTLQYNRNG